MAEHAILRSRRLLTILNLYEWAGRKHFVSLKLEGQSGVRTRDLPLSKQSALTTAPENAAPIGQYGNIYMHEVTKIDIAYCNIHVLDNHVTFSLGEIHTLTALSTTKLVFNPCISRINHRYCHRNECLTI